MNERIQELAEQAENYANEQNDKFGLSYKREYNKKFAELIVRECIDICYKHPARMPSNNWPGVTVPVDIAQRLEEHFGVEG